MPRVFPYPAGPLAARPPAGRAALGATLAVMLSLLALAAACSSPDDVTPVTPSPVSVDQTGADDRQMAPPLTPATGRNGSLLTSNPVQLPASLRAVDLAIAGTGSIDWSVRNDGPGAVADPFFVDLYLGAAFVHRWVIDGLEPGAHVAVRGWDGLARLGVEPAEDLSTLRLVVDPTHLIDDVHVSRRTLEREMPWGTPAEPPAEYARMPDLAAAPPAGGASPIVASSDPDAAVSGRLSVDAPTYISYGVRNIGLASVGSEVMVDIYFNDMLVRRSTFPGLLADQQGDARGWTELANTVRLEPGVHTLRMEIDPLNLVREAGLENNSYEIELEWVAGAPPPPTPSPPAPEPSPVPERDTAHPNLVPVTLFGWDGPLVARSGTAAGIPRGRDGPLTVMEPAHISFSFWNASPAPTRRNFRATVSVDGDVLESILFSGGSADGGAVWTAGVELAAGAIPAGERTVRVVIDPDGIVGESTAANKAFERTLTWLDGAPPPPAPPTRYTPAQLQTFVAPLHELMLATAKLADEDGLDHVRVEQVMRAAETAYYLATGSALADERIVIEILPRTEYEERRSVICLASSAALPDSAYAARVDHCREQRDLEAGLKARHDGRVHVVVDAGHTPAAVLTTLFHELGHAKQDLRAPGQTEGPGSDALDAIREAQAQLFEAAAWRSLEEFTGLPLMLYPAYPVMHENLDNRIDRRLQGAAASHEHSMGYVIMWLVALRGQVDPDIARELRDKGQLSAASAIALYESLLQVPPHTADAWLRDLLKDAAPYISEYRAMAHGRLVPGLPQDEEGHPALREVAFLAP